MTQHLTCLCGNHLAPTDNEVCSECREAAARRAGRKLSTVAAPIPEEGGHESEESEVGEEVKCAEKETSKALKKMIKTNDTTAGKHPRL